MTIPNPIIPEAPMANAIDDVKILPCPFCGYALTAEEGLCPHSGWHSEDDGEWHLTGICCPTCAVFLPKPSENATTADAIDAWNSRVEQVSTARQGENISVEVSDDKLSYLRDRVGSGGGIDGPDAYALLTELRDRRASPAPSQHTGWSDEAVEGEPSRLWLSAADADGEREVWFDPDEGGTLYVRADIQQGEIAEMTVQLHAAQNDLSASIEHIIDAVMETERYAPKTIPMGATAPLFNGMRVDNDGPWLPRVDVARKLRSVLASPAIGEKE